MQTIEDIIVELAAKGTNAAYVGRLCPMQLGHQMLADIMRRAFPDRNLIALGSCNHAPSMRHVFHYGDRSDFVLAVYPDARIVPLPDFDGRNDLWFLAFDHLLRAAGFDPRETVFIGGSREDTEFYEGTGRRTLLVNRYAGITKNVSGSEVRDALIERRSLVGMLDERIIPLVTERFVERWSELRRM